jgi:hypothetical protein
MRFLSVYTHVERNTPPTGEEMARMGQLIEEGMKSGWLVSTEGCLPSAMGARVRRTGTKVTVTDGPFAEAKELIGGFAILEAGSKEDAIALAKRFLEVAGEGECEIRQLYTAEGASGGEAAADHGQLSEQYATR